MQKELIDFCFIHHPPRPDQIKKYDTVRSRFKEMAEMIKNICPETRERDQSMVNLEQAMFWANASIAREEIYKNSEG